MTSAEEDWATAPEAPLVAMRSLVAKPSLVVMGDQDHIFFKAAQQFTEVHRNVRLRVIENCGHVCSIEAPELFNELVLKFLDGAEFPQRVTATPVPMSWSELKAIHQPKA